GTESTAEIRFLQSCSWFDVENDVGRPPRFPGFRIEYLKRVAKLDIYRIEFHRIENNTGRGDQSKLGILIDPVPLRAKNTPRHHSFNAGFGADDTFLEPLSRSSIGLTDIGSNSD